MDKEQIKKALDHFENDEYTDAQEILQKEISDAKYEHLNKKLNLDEGYKKKMKNEEEDEDEDEKDEDEDEDEDEEKEEEDED